MLKERLMQDLKDAMKNKDEIKKNTVQMVRAAILQIIAKEVKSKKDVIKDFEKAERQDLIDQTNKEIEILQNYLPRQLSKEEIKEELKKIIEDLGATSIKDMGNIMKEAKAKFGASADGKTINEVAKELLNV